MKAVNTLEDVIEKQKPKEISNTNIYSPEIDFFSTILHVMCLEGEFPLI